MTTQVELAKCPLLQEYFKTHMREEHKYMFIVGKCGNSDCKFNCPPLRMPRASFDWLNRRPRIVPFPMHRASSGKDHFASYDELKSVPTTEAHLPSYEAPKEPPKEAKAADKKRFNFGITNHARAFVPCADCSKPRLLFAAKGLTSNETDLLEARLDNVIYTCGTDQLFDEGHVLEKKVFVRSALTCGMPVEKAYYGVGKFPACCCWCGETNAERLVDLSQLDLGGKKGYPICTNCHGRGLDVQTHGQAVKTGAAAQKAKGKGRAAQHKGRQKAAAKQKRRAVVSSSDDDDAGEEEEDGEEEGGEESEGEGEGEEMDEAEAEAARWGGAAGQQEAGIWTVERILAKEERSDGTFYFVDWQGWALDEASWEPLSNLLTANAEVRAFEEVLAAMPRLDAFVDASQSGCCFGKLCQFNTVAGPSLDKCASCGCEHHHLCASENSWLKWIGDKSIEGRKCFDCWLLEAQLKQTVHPLQLQVYYKQLADWSRVLLSPFSVGAFLALTALPLQPVVKTSQRARLPPASGKCKKCKLGGKLLACSFCNAVYHNSDACLGEAKLSDALAASACFPWACPTCFKKGVASVQRTVLKPTGQRAAGVKRKRRK